MLPFTFSFTLFYDETPVVKLNCPQIRGKKKKNHNTKLGSIVYQDHYYSFAFDPSEV